MASLIGKCHCGSVSYNYQGEIVKSTYCDCRGCQKATGTLKAPYVTVKAAPFSQKGETRQFNNPAGEKCDVYGKWHFCPKCGAPVFWKGNKGDELDILAGTLDDTKWFQPKE
jgi:hypothetical protein